MGPVRGASKMCCGPVRGAVLPGRNYERSEASTCNSYGAWKLARTTAQEDRNTIARTAAREDRNTIARTAAQETSSYDSYLRPAGMLQLFSSASMRIVDWYTFDCLKSVAAT